MLNYSDEIETLWNQSSQTHEKESLHKNNPYRCNTCKQQAISPVVSHCGHIYCWKCITNKFKSNHCKCSCCKQQLMLQYLRPIYISGIDHEDLHPPRPKPKNAQPIANPTRFSTIPVHKVQINNIQSGKIVAGLGYFPSTFTLAFSTFSQPSTNNLSSMQKNITESINRIQTTLIISVPLVILVFLLVSYII